VRSIKDLLARLSDRGCHLVENDGVLEVAGQVKNLAPPPPRKRLKSTRQPSTLVHALREKCLKLLPFVDGVSRHTERLARLPELSAMEERLASAER
jgi:hypothetical protein